MGCVLFMRSMLDERVLCSEQFIRLYLLKKPGKKFSFSHNKLNELKLNLKFPGIKNFLIIALTVYKKNA